MGAWYNEIDPQKAAWLRQLIRENVIAQGEVDERSIAEIRPDEIKGFTQCHFFAGIGVWSYALRLAGWPDDRPVWTGSCPCPSFSCAGKGQGFDDPRHLWPAWYRLIPECAPATIFGEQADDAIGYGWVDLVQTDLERAAYSVGKAVLGACSIGGPHIRQRLYFCAYAENSNRRRRECRTETGVETSPKRRVGPAGSGGIERSTDLQSIGRSRREDDQNGRWGQCAPRRNGEIGNSSNSEHHGHNSSRRTEAIADSHEPQERIPDRDCSTSSSSDSDGRIAGNRDLQRSGQRRLFEEDCRTRKRENAVWNGWRTWGTSEPGQEGRPTLADNGSGISERSNTSSQGLQDSESAELRRERWREEGRAVTEPSEASSHGGYSESRGQPMRWISPGIARHAALTGATGGFWAECDWWYGRDGKYRPIEPGLFPLAHGATNRVLKLRGYGDAIIPQVAAEFIQASEEADISLRDGRNRQHMNLVHIAVSPVPLTAGVEQQALCGTRIPKAQWIWTAEHGGQAIKDIFTRLTICADCWRCEWDGHYVYGIVRGGEHR